MYVGPEGISNLNRLMKDAFVRNMPSDPEALLEKQRCPVSFYEETLNLLSRCAMGSNVRAESVCRSWIPLRHCAELLTAPWCAPGVKIALLRFVKEAHFDTGETSARRQAFLDRSSWRIIAYLRKTLQRVVNLSGQTFCQIEGSPFYGLLSKDVEEKLVVGSYELLTVFVGRCYRPGKEVNKPDFDELALLTDILLRVLIEGGLKSHVSKALVTTLTVLDKFDCAATETVKQSLKTYLKSAFMDSIGLDSSSKNSSSILSRDPRLQLAAFTQDLDRRLDTTAETQALCSTFESNPAAVQIITRNLFKSTQSTRQQSAQVLKDCVGILEHLWTSLCTTRPLKEVMETMGIDYLIAALVSLMAQGSDSKVEAALKLACTLLKPDPGGTLKQRPIQDKFLQAMQKPEAHGMLTQLLHRIGMAYEEIREMRTIIVQLVADFYPTAVDPVKSLKDLFDQGAMQQGADVSGSYAALILEFVQGLCLGLPCRMQKLLGGCGHNVNLTKALALNICQLDVAGSVNELNIKTVIKYFKCLALLVQGPCQVNQHTIVRRTSLIRVMDIILCKMPDDPKLVYGSDWHENKWLLQSSIATLLLGLLEAHTIDRTICHELMDGLDLKYMLDYMLSCYRVIRYNSSERMRTQASETGFQYYRVLRTLADCYNAEVPQVPQVAQEAQLPPLPNPSHRALEYLLFKDHPALAYFRDGVGSIELCLHNLPTSPNLCRIYFRTPDICKGVTREMRQTILWSVKRSSDAERLLSFCSLVKDLYIELKWMQTIRTYATVCEKV
jgi:hypothetical protein